MSRPWLARSIWFTAASVAVLLLAACPPAPDGTEGGDSTDAGQTRRQQEVGDQSHVVVAAMPDQRRNCLSRKFGNGNTVALRGGKDTITILAHDSTVEYDLAALEQGEHAIAILIDNHSSGFPDYAVAPGDTSCWAVQAQGSGLRSVFYGRDLTVIRPLTIELHTKRHGRPDADWITERRYKFESLTETSAHPEPGWLPEFLRPGVAHAQVVYAEAYAEDSTESGGSGPWSTCTRYGCCKPR